MLEEHKRLDEKIKSLKNQIKRFPEGKLICARNGKHYKWYQSNLHTKTYIPKKKRQLAEKLAAKKYSMLLLEELESEKNAIEFYLRHHNRKFGIAEKLLTTSSEYQMLLATHFKPLSQELADWSNSSYETNPLHPEQLIYKGTSGKLLRSKSEVMIDMLLYTNNIPFRYEAPLVLGETTIYPDFTIRHPQTGEFFYWEHFGMMDNATYCKSVFAKMQLYAMHGIVPQIHLITTYETKTAPLNTDIIEKMIGHYFL